MHAPQGGAASRRIDANVTHAARAAAFRVTAATSAWVLYREIRRWLGNAPFPKASFVLRIGAALAAAAVGARAAGALGRAPDATATVLPLFLGGVGGLAVFAAAALALRLVPVEATAWAGRWLRQRAETPPL